MTDNDLSFFLEQDQPIMAPIRSDKVVRNNNTVFYQAQQVSRPSQSKSLNVLAHDKISTKLEVNQEFLDYVAGDQVNADLAIVTFMGPRLIGKSFLVDCIVSEEESKISREMTRNGQPLVNMPSKWLTGRNGERIFLFDCDSSIQKEVFLWSYFLSATMVLNLNPLDRSGQEDFIKNLSFLQSHLDSDPDDLSLPKLIILRRDSQSEQFNEKEFLQRVKDYGLFQPDIVTLNFSYPGSVTVKAKQILNVPEAALNKNFLKDVRNLHHLLKSTAGVKTIRGNPLGTKILSLTVDPLTKTVNKAKKINTIKIWEDVIETLAVGYYNFYILKYSEQLQKQFEDEKPCDKYTLYKRLSGVKRKVNKKVQGFNTIAGDPIFEKYREKLNEKILSKEKLIKEINRQKSRKKNDQYCKKLFREMDDSNCARLIDEYCKSSLDDEKTEVLLENFQAIINQRIKDMERAKDPSKKPSKEIQELEQELQNVQREIQEQKKINVAVVAYDFDTLKTTISKKQKELNKLERELDEQKEISNKKKTSQNKDILELEKNIEDLKKKTKTQEVQIQRLQDQRNAKIDQMTAKLRGQLVKQEEKLAQLEELVRKAKQNASQAKGAEQGSKNKGCCQIM